MAGSLECQECARTKSLLGACTPPEDWGGYQLHLESCESCQQRFDHAEPGGESFLRLVRQAGALATRPTEPALAAMLEQLHQSKSAFEPSPDDPVDLYFLSPTDQPGLLGTLGEYQVHKVIGQGGMGVVLQAHDPRLDRMVAIKVLAAAVAGSATARRRFAREAQAAAAVTHENIVVVHGVQEADGLPYLVMQHVEGESLQDRLDRTGPLSLLEIVRFGCQTASGLAVAHAQGLIHRDIKPANLLLEGDPARIKITDFGLARMADDVQVTQNGMVAGTPAYMAPEQARGESVDLRADLYSLGCVLYAMATGVPPFQGATSAAILRQLSEDTPRPIRQVDPRLPEWLECLMARLLAKDPAERFQSAAEVGALLEGYLAHLRSPDKAVAPQLPPAPPAGPSKHSVLHRWRHLAQQLLVLLVGLGLGMTLWQLAGVDPQGVSVPPFEFHHDFRGQPLPGTLLRIGDPEERCIEEKPQGLRVKILKPWIHPWGGVGVRTAFGVKGDFEITATYEVRHADVPQGGYGVGICLRARKAEPAVGHVSWARLVRQRGGPMLVWDQSLPVPGGPARVIEGGYVSAAESVARLRLKRTGETMSFLWAPGPSGEDFKEVKQIAFGNEDLQHIELCGVTGRQPLTLDVRFLDLKIQGTVPTTQGTSPESEPTRRRGWLLVGGVALAALAISCLGVWLLARSRNRPGGNSRREPIPEKCATPGTQAESPIAFTCPHCGKSLRCRAELGGKSGKCPNCGKALHVPACDAGE